MTLIRKGPRNFTSRCIKKLQVQIESEFNALFNVCLSSANMMGSLQGTIEDQARAFLTTRLGQLNLSQMFFARFPDATTASQALLWLHDQAAPPVKMGPVATSETVILGGPAGADGQHFQQLGHYALPAPPTDYVVTDDEILVYREYAQVPLTSLPQLGPLAEDAYNAALDTTHGSPHSRNDVRTWQDVEVC